MTYRQFQMLNRLRSETHFGDRCVDWNIADWSNALAGEAGELCNWVKKVRRGDAPLEQLREAILKEAADVITYADAIISFLGADTETVLIDKFNEVSSRPGNGFPQVTRDEAPLPMEDLTRANYMAALRSCNGNRSQACRLLGVSRTTFYRKVKEYQS